MVKKMSRGERFYVGLIFFLLYAPLLVLMVCSFNDSKSRAKWGGFTLHWYTDLFSDAQVISAIKTSAAITVLAALIATVIGVGACIGMGALSKKSAGILQGAVNIPLLNADIVTGIGIMFVCVRFIDLGFTSVLVAHVTLGVPYVILNVMPKIQQLDKNIYDAALDLGANHLQAFFKVVLPELFGSILSGFLMAFTISLDDFVITYFTKGAGMNTISTMIYQQVRRGINPEMYALSTLLFVVVLLVLCLVNHLGKRKEEKEVARL